MQNPPVKGPTVQKPCTDRADPAFGPLIKSQMLYRLSYERISL